MGIFNKFKDRLMHAAFNTFSKEDPNRYVSWGGGAGSYGVNPSRARMSTSGDKTVITAIYNQIAIDVASHRLAHVRVDLETDRFVEMMPNSGLNDCLIFEANIDEGARAFRQNIAMALFDKGVAAICIMEADKDPETSMSYNIEKLRVGEIRAWFPEHVRGLIYNEVSGNREEITLPKKQVAIVENPLYAVMNDEVSTLKRLTRKLSILDAIDEQAGSGKLDIIIQLPYVVKSESRKQQAAQRRQDMEEQLYNSKYGVAYADATEKITQLNRPAENNMLAQVEFLTKQLYSQLGIPKDVFDGTADERTMINYHNRTIDPILTAITEAMERKFLSKTARSQGQRVRYFKDPFKNMALSEIADIGDKLSRNEVVTSNELRSALGLRPSKEAKADKLQNANMPNEDNVGAAKAAASSDSNSNPPPAATQERQVNLQNDSSDKHQNQYS
jgi:hypothetical protein